MAIEISGPSKKIFLLKENSIIHLFEEQIKQTPYNIAVSEEDCNISYFDLDLKANMLAVYFSEIGIKKGDIVVVCVSKSVKQIVSLIGLLKLGAIYLPLSTEISNTRLEFVQKNSQFKYAIYNNLTKNKFSSNRNILGINIEEIFDKLNYSFEELDKLKHEARKISPTDPAYIIYTSGTTGFPKGVIASHGAVTNLVKKQNYIDISSKDTFLFLSPIEFDASTFEIWGALLNGARLILMPPGFPELKTIVDFIKKFGISILFLTTQLFNSLVDLHLEDLTNVEKLLFGGEQASAERVQKFLKDRNKNIWLCNIYGPTECTTFSTFFEINHPMFPKVPIGKPISNAFCVALNSEQKTVKEGEIGELYIGGAGVFLGYLNDPYLTSQKIIEYTDVAKNTKYQIFKTGDIVKALSNNNYEFVGRVDRQVKIRGFRVNLEEVENCIREYNKIYDAAVLPLEEKSYGINLIGFFVVKDEAGFKVQEFKNYFLSHHPMYMYPNKIIFVKALPLNNNKVSYEKLFEIYEEIKTSLLPLKNKGHEIDTLTNKIIEIWKAELNLADVDIHDDFFDLGGHSLIFINILSKFQKEINFPELKNLSIIDLFSYPTINSLVNYVRNEQDV